MLSELRIMQKVVYSMYANQKLAEPVPILKNATVHSFATFF